MTDRSSRLLAAIAYLLLLVGPLVLLTVRRGGDFVRYHSRQSLGLAASAVGAFVVWVVVGWVISLLPYWGFLLAVILFAVVIGLFIVLAILWINGMVNSLRGKRLALPVIGRYIDRFLGRAIAGGAAAVSPTRRDPA